MQNEFEKQVQQKMEELKLVPSEPVWQKVEMQIRKKKDRRRVIFWILFPVLLLGGGGLWFGVDQYSNNSVSSKNNLEKINQSIQKQNSPVQPEQSIVEKNINEPKKNSSNRLVVRSVEKMPSTSISTNENVHFATGSLQKKSIQKPQPSKKNSVTERNKKSSIKNDETVFTEAQIKSADKAVEPGSENQKEDQQPNTNSNLTSTQAENKIDSLIKDESKVETNLSKTDSIKNDSVAVKQLHAKKYATSKWKTAVTVSAGFSGTGRLNTFSDLFGNDQKSFQSSPNYSSGSPGSGSQAYYGPSEVTNGFSFSAGAAIKKELGRRKNFSAGLQYNYYSNSILVGSRIVQNTVLRYYNVSQYYSNNQIGNGATNFQSYTNRYHFISLPLAIDWQLLKKHPLNLYTDLSVQYLLQTNGLVFDYSKQAYFHNIKAFNRTQLFSGLGVNYSFPIKNNAITIGPALQYGLSRLEKDNSEHHLFMYGLKAQLQFNKK